MFATLNDARPEPVACSVMRLRTPGPAYVGEPAESLATTWKEPSVSSGAPGLSKTDESVTEAPLLSVRTCSLSTPVTWSRAAS